MPVVNTNVSASITQSALAKNERTLESAMEKLSTGSKINSASDDAAGLAMAAKFSSQIQGLDMAVKNANDAISMLSTAEGALDEVTNILQRMRELSVQASNGTVTAEDRDYIDLEYQALNSEISRIANNTQWNGENVLDGTAGAQGVNASTSNSTVTFQVSANYAAVYAAGDTFDGITLAAGGTSATTATTSGEAVTHNSIIGQTQAQVAAGGVNTGTGTPSGAGNDIISVDFGNLVTDMATITASNVQTQTDAQAAVAKLDAGITAISEQRATFGSAANRLEHAVDNMTNIRNNAEASRSRIEDTDYAETTSELARAQIIQQAGTAMLAQANQLPQSVLSLLK